jgi:hypothetical protein
MPRITLMLLVILIVAYIVGAKWPGLAQRFGIA